MQEYLYIIISCLHLYGSTLHCVGQQGTCTARADSGFFLGGGAPLRNGLTDCRIGRKQILIANTKKKAGHLREGCTPPASSP